MNGYAKWAMVVIVIIGVLFAAGYSIQNNTNNIAGVDKELQEQVIKKEFDKRISLVENDIGYIKKGIDEIKARLP